MLILLRLLGLWLSGYPFAFLLKLPWGRRLLASATLGLIGGPAVAWVTGTLIGRIRPDLPVLIFSALGLILFTRDLYRDRWRFRFVRGSGLPIVIALILISLQQGVMVTSGWREGALYLAAHHSTDAMVHLAISSVLRPGAEYAIPWPPPIPFFAGQLLVNYHPLADVLLALVAAQAEQVTAYFRILPVIYSALLVGSVYWTLEEWGVQSRLVRATGMSLAVLCGSFGHLVHLFGPAEDPFWESHFWMSQPFSMLYNPPFSLSLCATLTGLAVLARWHQRPWSSALSLGVLWGLGYGVKAFMTLLLLPALGMAFLFAPKSERMRLLLAVGAVTLGALIMFALTTQNAQESIYLDPLWPLKTLPKRLAMAPLDAWPVSRAIAWLWVGFLFLVGNLGVRVLALPALWGVLKNRPRGPEVSQYVAAVASVLGVAFPLLFAARGIRWNTIQFGYYPLAILSLWTAIRLGTLFGKLRPWTRGAGVVGVAALALPTSANTLALTNYGAVIPREEVELLHQLARITPVGATVLISPAYISGRRPLAYGTFQAPTTSTETSYVPAISGRPAYVADPMTLEVLRVNYRDRWIEINRLFSVHSLPEVIDWARQRKISAIYSFPHVEQIQAATR